MKKPILILAFLLLFLPKLFTQPTGFNYERLIEISPGAIAGITPLINYPFYFSFTNPSLMHSSNGGHIEHIDGYDVVFYDEANNSMDFQIDSYDPVNGTYSAHILIPSLDPSDPPDIKVHYGNASISSSQESSDTWSSEYSSVYHLDEDSGTSTDDTSGSSNGTQNGGVSTASGNSGDASCFDGTDDYIQIPDQDYSDGADDGLTLSFWFNISDLSGASFQYLYSHGDFGTQNSINVFFIEDNYATSSLQGVLRTAIQDDNDTQDLDNLDIPAGLADGMWHQYTLVQASGLSGVAVYIDGIKVTEDLLRGNLPTNPNSDIFVGARNDLDASRFTTGKIDELRIQNVQRPPSWIQTEFNNISDPMAFYTVTGEALPVEFISFDVKLITDNSVKLEWSTASEVNNDYFVVRRSTDAKTWLSIDTLKGQGHSNVKTDYSIIDGNLASGVHYYQIMQVDFDGSYSFSIVKTIRIRGEVRIYPNPTNDLINIQSTNKINKNHLQLFNAHGDDINLPLIMINEYTAKVDLSFLPAAIYYFEIDNIKYRLIKR